MNIAVIFAGGAGRRMNTRAIPKQFLEMHGKPVLVYTLEQFENHSQIDAIVLVCIELWVDYANKLIRDYHLQKVVAVVPGGETGQESIFEGLSHARQLSKSNKDVVLVHDGVRPLIDARTITACLDSVTLYGNAVTTTPAIETIFVQEETGEVGQIFNRSRCAMARAPQCFYLSDLYETHLRAQAEERYDFIDSAMMMQHYGAELHTVTGPIENIKITTPTDFYLFRALLDAKENMQIVGL
ncbi:MAG: 2-C-methyl-D-erythritol 4-phosphate cytidylyltransferase [Selenomonas massiliensis]